MKKNYSNNSLSVRNKVSQAAYGTYFLVAILFVTWRMLLSFGVFDFIPEFARSIISTIFIQIVLMFSVTIFMFSGLLKRKPKEGLKFFGYKKITKKAWLIALVLGVIVFFLNSYIASFFASVLEFLGFRSGGEMPTSYPWWMFILNIFLTALLPAVCEETAHRGLLMRGSLCFGSTRAIIISSLMFGLMHMNIQQVFYATIIGFYLGYLAIHSDSIYPSMVVHFMNNALSTLMTFSLVNNLGFGNFINKVTAISNEHVVLGVMFNVVFIAVLIIGLVYFTKKLIHETSEARIKDLQSHIYNDLVKQEYMENISQSKKAIKGEVGDKPEEIYVDVEEMFLDKNIELGYMTTIDRQMLQDEKRYKPDLISMLSLSLSFAVGLIATIFTLVWGLMI